MTGLAVFRQALRLLNYTDVLGDTNSSHRAELYKQGLALVDQLCGELFAAETGTAASPMTSLNDPVPVSDRTAREVLPYGVAMLLAAGQGDGDNQSLFAALYSQKRVAVNRSFQRIRDVLPRGCDE